MPHYIAELLRTCGLTHLLPRFTEQKIDDINLLKTLNDEELKELIPILGERKKFQAGMSMIVTPEIVISLNETSEDVTIPLINIDNSSENVNAEESLEPLEKRLKLSTDLDIDLLSTSSLNEMEGMPSSTNSDAIEYSNIVLKVNDIVNFNIKSLLNTHIIGRAILLKYDKGIIFDNKDYEAFHKQLKATAKISTSRVNLLLTLCIKQQLKLSYRLLSRKGLSNPIECGQFISELHNIKEIRLQCIINACNIIFSEEANVFGCIKINNIKYNIKNVLQINDTEFDTFLEFGLIQYIIMDQKDIIFILAALTTVTFQNHLQAYEISINQDAQWFLISWDKLANKFPYNIHMMGDGKNYIIPLQ